MNKNEGLTRQLGEPERVTEERKALNTILDTLKNAMKVFKEIQISLTLLSEMMNWERSFD